MNILSISSPSKKKNSIFRVDSHVVSLFLGVIAIGGTSVAFSAEVFEEVRAAALLIEAGVSEHKKEDVPKKKKKSTDAIYIAELSLSSGEDAAKKEKMGGDVVQIADLNSAGVDAATAESSQEKKIKNNSIKLAQLGGNLNNRFNTAFLYGAAPTVDMDFIFQGGSVPEGEYLLDFFVNSMRSIRENVIFSFNEDTGVVEPCFTADLFRKIGVNFDGLLGKELDVNTKSCMRINEVIPHATAKYDSSKLQMDVGIPQAYMHESKRGYIDPVLWSDGVPVVFANYNISLSSNKGSLYDNTYTGVALSSGANWGAWHFRNNASMSRSSGQKEHWSSQNTYVQRDLTKLKSQFWLGQTYRKSDLFDSVRFMGVQISTDESMFPTSEQGYAPVIRGTAESNATVEIRQDGYLLYSENVAAGPFVIDDLNPSGSNGNLEVTVIEADGRRLTTIEAFSRPPLMVREGRLKYAATAGRYKQVIGSNDDPFFTSASAVYGLTSNMTVAAGMEMTSGYRGIAAGVGVNSKLGALSLEVTHSRSSLLGESKSGESLRFAYSKYFQNTSTSVAFSANHSMSENYRNMSEHIYLKNDGRPVGLVAAGGGVRSQIVANIMQSLGENQKYGSFYFTATDLHYWNSGTSRNISIGYSRSVGSLGLNIAYSNLRNPSTNWGLSARNSNTVSVSLSVPLDFGETHHYYSTTTFTKAKEGNSFFTNVSGNFDDHKDINYSLNVGHDPWSGTSSGFYIGTNTTYGNMSMGYSHSSVSKNVNAQANGSIVWHQHGINMGQYVGESFALVKLDPPVAGVQVAYNSKVETGYNGVAIVPYMSPYRHNWVGVNAAGSASEDGSDVEVEAGMLQVVPRRGAAVLAEFRSEVGRRIQFEFLLPDGASMPFGAQVMNEQGHRLALTDPRGRALTMLNGKADNGVLMVQWGTSECRLPYQLPEKVKSENYQRVKLTCDKVEEFVPVPQKALRMELALQ